MDFLDSLIDFEQGNLNQEQTAELFQKLVDSGMVWQLQGLYGRTAQSLIDVGLVTPPRRN